MCLNHYDRVQCNITAALHYCKTTLHKVNFFACKQDLHLEGSQEVTQEPDAKGDVNARGGERKEIRACNNLLQIFISTQETARC